MKRLYVTQQQAAALLGVGTVSLWRWERAGYITRPKRVGYSKQFEFYRLYREVLRRRLPIGRYAAKVED